MRLSRGGKGELPVQSLKQGKTKFVRSALRKENRAVRQEVLGAAHHQPSAV
jgi:hypothetical protein